MKTQTSSERGDRNENKSGGCLTGFEKRMLMPGDEVIKLYKKICIKTILSDHYIETFLLSMMKAFFMK